MKRIWIFLILLVVSTIPGCSRDSNPLEEEQVPGTPEVEYSLGQGEIILSWKQCDNAQKYIIYKSEKIDGEFVSKDPSFSTRTEFTDKYIVEDQTYQYIVAAITARGLEGYDSDPVTISYKPPKIVILDFEEPQRELKRLDFNKSQRELNFIIKNTGGEALEWQISSQERWLTFLPEEGQISAGGTGDVSARVDRGLLEWGEHQGRASIIYDGGTIEIEAMVIKIGIYGIVVDSRTDAPIDHAEILLNGEMQSTSPGGDFAFPIPEYGNFTLLASKDGYIPTEASIIVDQGKTEPVRIQLRPIPETVGTISGDFDGPTYIAFSGDRAYITNEFGNSVTVINAFDDTTITTIEVGDRPIGIAANPVKDEVYVANNWSSSISVIETESNKKVADIDVGKFPTSLVVSPDGDLLYSVNSRSDNISVIDINQRRVSGDIQVGEEPYGIIITPDGAYLYVTNSKEDTVSIVDTGSKQQIGTVSVGQDPADIKVSSDGQQIYVSVGSTDGRLMIIDASTNTIVGEHRTGSNPRGLAVSEDVVYVVARGDDRVELLDATRNVMVEQTIDVGLRPIGIATNGEKIYVANSIANTVSVLEFP